MTDGKLVRDLIPELIRQSGGRRTLLGPELQALIAALAVHRLAAVDCSQIAEQGRGMTYYAQPYCPPRKPMPHRQVPFDGQGDHRWVSATIPRIATHN
jgi:hypothetical protein